MSTKRPKMIQPLEALVKQVDRKLGLISSKAVLRSINEFDPKVYFENPVFVRGQEKEYTEALRERYEQIYKSAQRQVELAPFSEEELNHNNEFYDAMFRITENDAFWITHRTIGKDDEIISQIKVPERQKALIKVLNQHPYDFLDFSNLRTNAINFVHTALDEVQTGKKLISSEKHHFLKYGN